jgi:hypothetical protein
VRWRWPRAVPAVEPESLTAINDLPVVEAAARKHVQQLHTARIERPKLRPPELVRLESLHGQRYRLMIREGFESRPAVARWRADRGLPVGRLCSSSVRSSTWAKFGEPTPVEEAPDAPTGRFTTATRSRHGAGTRPGPGEPILVALDALRELPISLTECPARRPRVLETPGTDSQDLWTLGRPEACVSPLELVERLKRDAESPRSATYRMLAARDAVAVRTRPLAAAWDPVLSSTV